MHSEIVNGFGFSVPAHNPDLFKKFILNHQKAIEEQGAPEEKKLLNTAKFDKNYSFDYDDIERDFSLESVVNEQEGEPQCNRKELAKRFLPKSLI